MHRASPSRESPVTVQDDFPRRLERLRAAGVLRHDLTGAEPARGDPGADGTGRTDPRGPTLPPGEALAAAREAVAGYLAGHRASVRPEHVFFVPALAAARRRAAAAVATSADELLVPAPARPFLEPAAESPRSRPYPLAFGEEWHVDLRALRRAIGPDTRAVVLGNPAEPTGSMLTRAALADVEDLCAARGLAVIGDEAHLDAALRGSVSVARAERVLALHVSGVAGVCGVPGAAWIALAGPPGLVDGAAARLERLAAAEGEPAALGALPALLARRGPHLAALRDRLARNCGAIARAALREAPWSLLWGGGGPWAVLQINPIREDRELCLELLDEGVAVLPGSVFGFPPTGQVVVSLRTEPDVLLGGLEALERHLRGIA